MTVQTWFKRTFIPVPEPPDAQAPADVSSREVPRQQSIVILGILTFATMGVYAFVWFAQTWALMSRERKSARSHSLIHAFLVVVPLTAGAILMMNWPLGWYHLIALAPLSLSLSQLYKHFQAMSLTFKAANTVGEVRPKIPIITTSGAIGGIPLLAALIDWANAIDPNGVTPAVGFLTSYQLFLLPVALIAIAIYGQLAINNYLEDRYGANSARKIGTLTALALIPASLIVVMTVATMLLSIAQWSSLSNRAETLMEWLIFGYQYPTTGIVLTETDVWTVDMEGDRVLQFERATGAQVGAIEVGDRPYGLAIAERDLWVTNRTDETIFRIDLDTMTVIEQIKLHNRPTTLVYGEGSLWVALSSGSEILRLDPVTHEVVAEIEVGLNPAGLAVNDGVVWVTTLQSAKLVKIDAQTNSVLSETFVQCMPIDVAVGHGSVWVSRAGGCNILRLDPETLEEQAIIPSRTRPWVLIPAEEGIWVAHQANAISRIDPEINRVVAFQAVDDYLTGMTMDEDSLWIQYIEDGRVERHSKAAVPENGSTIPVGTWSGGMLVDGNDIWVTSIYDDTVSRIDRELLEVTAVIRVGGEPSGIAVDDESIWVTNSLDNTVSRIDKRANRVVETIEVGGQPAGVTIAMDKVWVVNHGDSNVSVIDPATNEIVQTYGVELWPTGIAEGFDSIWVANYGIETVSRIDLQDPSADVESIDVGELPTAVIAHDGSIWVSSEGGDLLTRIDPETNEVVAEIPIDVPFDVEDRWTEPLQVEPTSLAIGRGMIWVSNTGSAVAIVDPETNQQIDLVSVNGMAFSIDVQDDELWVSNFEIATVSRINPEWVGSR
jgi:YVTN family beta-propeller protein